MAVSRRAAILSTVALALVLAPEIALAEDQVSGWQYRAGVAFMLGWEEHGGSDPTFGGDVFIEANQVRPLDEQNWIGANIQLGASALVGQTFVRGLVGAGWLHRFDCPVHLLVRAAVGPFLFEDRDAMPAWSWGLVPQVSADLIWAGDDHVFGGGRVLLEWPIDFDRNRPRWHQHLGFALYFGGRL